MYLVFCTIISCLDCDFLYQFNLINVTAGVNVKDKIAWVEIETWCLYWKQFPDCKKNKPNIWEWLFYTSRHTLCTRNTHFYRLIMITCNFGEGRRLIMYTGIIIFAPCYFRNITKVHQLTWFKIVSIGFCYVQVN